MITLSSTDRATLEADACNAILNEHDNAVASFSPGTPANRSKWEPCCVAHLCYSMGQVAADWRRTIKAVDPYATIRLSVVFTHQTPLVEWIDSGASKRCELADLMIAIVDRRGGRDKGQAVLIQAKQSDTNSVSLTTPSEQTQFELLSTRPVFDFVNGPAPARVDLTAMSPDCGLLYGLNPPDAIKFKKALFPNDRWRTADNLSSAARTYAATASPCLATLMVDMLIGSTGWTFDLSPSGKTWTSFTTIDPWSEVVNFLLEKSFKPGVAVLHNAGFPAGDRQHDYLMYSLTPARKPMFFLDSPDKGLKFPLSNLTTPQAVSGEWWEKCPQPDGPPRFPTAGDPADPQEDGGISAILIEIGEVLPE